MAPMQPVDSEPVNRDAAQEGRVVDRVFAAAASLAGTGLALMIGSHWLHWAWLWLASYGFFLGAFVILVIAMAYIFKAIAAALGGWPTNADARDKRRSQRQSAASQGSSNPPAA
jgi:uncharacterized membrane protein